MSVHISSENRLLDIRMMLRNERIQRRMSQTQLASKVGKSRKWLSELERGIIDPSFVSVIELMEVLEITFELNLNDDEQQTSLK